MLWCQGAQNIGLSSHILKSALKVHCMITIRLLSTFVPDRQPHRQTKHRRTNITTIARRLVLTNASSAKIHFTKTLRLSLLLLINLQRFWDNRFNTKYGIVVSFTTAEIFDDGSQIPLLWRVDVFQWCRTLMLIVLPLPSWPYWFWSWDVTLAYDFLTSKFNQSILF